MVVRAQKSADEYSSLVTRASNLALIDNDFLIALWGLRVGNKLNYIPDIHADMWRKESELLLTAHGLKEKDVMQLDDTSQLIDRMMSTEAALAGIRDHNKFNISLESKSHLLKKNKLGNYIWYAGWLINRLGVKIQKISPTLRD
jgi:hypothetical protein